MQHNPPLPQILPEGRTAEATILGALGRKS